MRNVTKETKMDLLDLSKRVTNSISFEEVEDISVNVDNMGDKLNRIQMDITFKENADV